MNPVAFTIGNFEIRWYSLLIFIGIIIGYLLANKESKKFNLPEDFIFNLTFYVIVFGIIGARIYYVLFNLSYYQANPTEIIKVWHGGLAIHGGIIAGLITTFIYCRHFKISVTRTCDIAVPSIIIAQAIGRWGNFFNSEAHGPVTTLNNLQNLHIPNFIIDGMKINGVYYHPTFLYESLWCILGFIILILIRKFYKYLKSGQLTCVYFMWYSLGRLFIEYLRTDSLMIGKYKVAQIISILFFVLSLLCFLYLCFNKLRKGRYYDKKVLKTDKSLENDEEKEENTKKDNA